MQNTNTNNLPEAFLIIKSYRKDVVLNFKYSAYNSYKKKSAKPRGKIKDFSWRSCRRLKLVARNVASKMKVTIDLTYPENFPTDGAIVKKHVDTFSKRLRRLNIKNLWVLEFQKRGAPHLHMMANGTVDKNLISKMWYEIVGSGDLKHLVRGTKIRKIDDESRVVNYISSYMKKLSQKIVPKGFENVGRFWGYSSSLLTFSQRIVSGKYVDLSRKFRLLRRWYKAKLRSWGIKWRWKGNGFIIWDGLAPSQLLRI